MVLLCGEVAARVCWVYCVVLALVNMEIFGSPPGMTVGEYRSPNPGYEFVSGFLRWLETVLVLVVCSVDSFLHGKIS